VSRFEVTLVNCQLSEQTQRHVSESILSSLGELNTPLVVRCRGVCVALNCGHFAQVVEPDVWRPEHRPVRFVRIDCQALFQRCTRPGNIPFLYKELAEVVEWHCQQGVVANSTCKRDGLVK
jgi:hypothetical protein